MELNHIALADANERAGHRAAIGPEGIFDAVGELADNFPYLEIYHDPGGKLARDWRRHVRWRSENSLLNGKRENFRREYHRSLGVGGTFIGMDRMVGDQRQ